jgi:hypothetical protein
MPTGRVSIAGTSLAICFLASQPVPATTSTDPIVIVRNLRAESNQAIANHDADSLRTIFADNYLGIEGTSGELDSGGEATAKSYIYREFNDPTFDMYQRTPDNFRLARSEKRIAESGHWVGIWHKPDGTMRKSGVYLARWMRSNDRWLLRSELFVTLDCQGSSACSGQD